MVRPGVPNRVALSADGKIFAASLPDNSVQLWDVETGKELRGSRGRRPGIADLLFSSDGKAIAVSGGHRSIHTDQDQNGDQMPRSRGSNRKARFAWLLAAAPSTEGTGLAFSPDGKTIATRSRIRPAKNLLLSQALRCRDRQGNPQNRD